MSHALDSFQTLNKEAVEAGFSSVGQATNFCLACEINKLKALMNYCDVTTLTILNESAENQVASFVSCEDIASRDQSLSVEQRELLGGADLYIEVPADWQLNVSDKPEKSKITIDGMTAPLCIAGAHPLLTWSPVFGAQSDCIESDTTVTEKKFSRSFELLAPSRALDLIDPTWGSILELIWPFARTSSRKVYDVALNSCGMRATSNPVNRLTARVVVVPISECKVTYKLPMSFKKRSSSYSSTIDARFQKIESQTTEQSGLNIINTKSEETKTFEKGGKVSVEKTVTIRDGKRILEEKTQRTENVNNSDFEEGISFEDKIKPEFNLEIEINKTKIDLDKAREFFSAALKIKNAFESLKDALLKLPKAGVWVDWDYQILTGTISGSWGYQGNTKKLHDRIVVAEIDGQINIDLTVAKGKFELSGGFKSVIENYFSETPILEVIATLSGKIEGEAKVNGSWSSKDGLAGKPEKVEGKIEGTIELTGVAMLNGQGTRIVAAGNISLGFDGELTIGGQKPFQMNCECEFVPPHFEVTATLGKKNSYRFDWPDKSSEPLKFGEFSWPE